MHISNIDRLARVPGIVAVAVTTSTASTATGTMLDTPWTFRGVECWAPMLAAALKLLEHSEEHTIGVSVGRHTIVAQREGAALIGVVVPTGHKAMKSLHRSIRQHAARAPRAEAPAEAATSEPVSHNAVSF